MDVSVEEAMSKLDEDMKLFFKQVKKGMIEKQQEVAIQAAERLVYYSPIWTGAYVRSMRCGIGVVDSSHEPVGPGTLPYPPRLSEMEAETIRMEMFSQLKSEIELNESGKIIYLSNNIPYATAVEFVGWYLTPDGKNFVQAAHHVFTTTTRDLEYMLK